MEPTIDDLRGYIQLVTWIALRILYAQYNIHNRSISDRNQIEIIRVLNRDNVDYTTNIAFRVTKDFQHDAVWVANNLKLIIDRINKWNELLKS